MMEVARDARLDSEQDLLCARADTLKDEIDEIVWCQDTHAHAVVHRKTKKLTLYRKHVAP